jgi:hypothetical protein
MKTKSRFVNNNKNVVNVIIQNPQKKRHTYHKSKESNSESASISSYSRPNISVPFTNTSNLENEILREQLNNIQSNRNPSMNRIGTIINDKFRNPLENADETFIKNGSNKEVTDVHSEVDEILNNAISQISPSKSLNYKIPMKKRLGRPKGSKNKPKIYAEPVTGAEVLAGGNIVSAEPIDESPKKSIKIRAMKRLNK